MDSFLANEVSDNKGGGGAREVISFSKERNTTLPG